MAENSNDLKSALENFLTHFDIQIDSQSNDEVSDPANYSEIISKTQTKLDELNERAEELYKKIGMTRDQVEDYVANPNNFTKEQWEALQNIKDEVEKFRRKTKEVVAREGVQQKIDSERRKPTQRFGKKKNWIPL